MENLSDLVRGPGKLWKCVNKCIQVTEIMACVKQSNFLKGFPYKLYALFDHFQPCKLCTSHGKS